LARSSCAIPISALVTSTMPNSASFHSPQTRITASRTPSSTLNLVKMFARKMSATERLVCSPAAFVSPRERRSATSALLSPPGGVHATGAAGAGATEAAASATRILHHDGTYRGDRRAGAARGRQRRR
jgi:hypothetical protein